MTPISAKYFVIFDEPAYTSMNSKEKAMGLSAGSFCVASPSSSSSSKDKSYAFRIEADGLSMRVYDPLFMVARYKTCIKRSSKEVSRIAPFFKEASVQ